MKFLQKLGYYSPRDLPYRPPDESPDVGEVAILALEELDIYDPDTADLTLATHWVNSLNGHIPTLDPSQCRLGFRSEAGAFELVLAVEEFWDEGGVLPINSRIRSMHTPVRTRSCILVTSTHPRFAGHYLLCASRQRLPGGRHRLLPCTPRGEKWKAHTRVHDFHHDGLMVSTLASAASDPNHDFGGRHDTGVRFGMAATWQDRNSLEWHNSPLRNDMRYRDTWFVTWADVRRHTSRRAINP